MEKSYLVLYKDFHGVQIINLYLKFEVVKFGVVFSQVK